MRTRNADAAKTPSVKKTPPLKKTPPVRKSAAKSTPCPTESTTPKSPDTKRAPVTRGKQAKNIPTTPTPNTTSPEPPEAKGSADTEQVTPKIALSSRPAARRASGRTKTPTAGKNVSKRTPKSVEILKEKVEKSTSTEEVADAKDVEFTKEDEHSVEYVGESTKEENIATRVDETTVINVGEPAKEDGSAIEVEETTMTNVGKPAKEDESATEVEEVPVPDAGESLREEKIAIESDEISKTDVGEYTEKGETVMEVEKHQLVTISESEKLEEAADEEIMKPLDNENPDALKEQLEEVTDELKVDEETKKREVEEENEPEPSKMEEDTNEENVDEEVKLEEKKNQDSSEMLECGDEEGLEEPEEEEIAAGNVGNKNQDSEVLECGDEEGLEEPEEEEIGAGNVGRLAEEAKTLEDEHMELTALAKENNVKREHEIYVGGLHRDAEEEDVRKVFETIGEVIEVRLHKSSSMNQNKGYAFVKFANKEHATRALSEMKNPLICGKRCSTASCEDNNTLFLGNICNTWTKEAIKQKLKDYGLEGVQIITLVPDAHHEGLSRGFAFLEFSCHADAMLAYKRLQKPDAIFGHLERTAKVAFAEPLREPDPEIMAQVKSVFIDGLPPHWDDNHVREQFKGYGEIERIMLARNMSSAKRKDFGFVDFATHEAAVACINGIHNKELGDGNSKMKVRARLSNPTPKTQAVKGGIYGGFRIGHVGGESSSKIGRGIAGRGGYSFNQANLQRGRGFYQHGRSQSGRTGFVNEYDFDKRYPDFHARQASGRGGGRGSFRGNYQEAGRGTAGAGPSRSFHDRPRHDASDRGRGRHILPRRQPFSPEGGFNRPFVGRHFDDPYLYDESVHGIKRPFYMTDQDPSYMETSRVRPRLDYSDHAVPFRGTHYRGTYEAANDLYPHHYYGPDYGGGPYSSFYGGDRPYHGDHPYGRGYY